MIGSTISGACQIRDRPLETGKRNNKTKPVINKNTIDQDFPSDLSVTKSKM